MTTDLSHAALLAQNYAVALQQAIEAHCRGESVPIEVATRCPHHARKLDARLAAADMPAVSGSDVPARPTSPAEDAAAKPVGFVRFITGRDAPQVEWCSDVEIRRDTPLYARPTMPAGMPTGYVPVPREATQRMLDAADKIIDCDPQWVAKAWNAMLAASPPLPQEQGAVPQAGTRAVVSSYTIDGNPRRAGGDDIRIERAKQIEGGPLWAVRKMGECLNHDGEWEYEPMPSSRDDDFIARCRFPTADAALQAALAVAPPVADPGQAGKGETK